jgi:hypothetical protein
MLEDGKSVKDTSVADLEALLNADEEETSQSPENEEIPASTPEAKGSTQKSPEPVKESETQAFAKRLRESTEKARAEEREALAKRMGKTSYDELLKETETKAFEAKGLDPEAAKEVFDKMYEERIKADPRFQELDDYRASKAKEWSESQMSELSKLTGGKITRLDQLDEATLKRAQTEGSFVSAYMALHGAKLLEEVRLNGIVKQQQNSTDHLISSTGKQPANAFREPTPEERKILAQFAQFSPNMEKDLDNIKYKK